MTKISRITTSAALRPALDSYPVWIKPNPVQLAAGSPAQLRAKAALALTRKGTPSGEGQP